MTRYSTGGRDADGELYPASFECDDCGLFLSWPVTEVLGGGAMPASEDPLAQPMLAMIREHDNGGCHRDAKASPDGLRPVTRAHPRNLYFGAEDRLLDGPQKLTEKYIPYERARRQKLIGNAITDAEQLIAALKAIRSFDTKGNAHCALPQVADALADVIAHTRNLVSDIESSIARYDEFDCPPVAGVPVDPVAYVEPSSRASAATGPKPGPAPVVVVTSPLVDPIGPALRAVVDHQKIGGQR